MISRRRALALGAATLMLPTLQAFAQPAYPSRPIQLVVPYTAGGPTDVAVRAIAEQVRHILGQPVIVENRAGANGTTGAATIARAKPDGYTLAILPASVYREPHINKVAFDPLTSFTYISLLTDFVFGFAVNAESPWKTFADFAAAARAEPGKLSVGAGGGPIGSPMIAIDELADAAKIKYTSVPFKGDADVAVAVMGNHIDAAALSGVAVPHIEAGRMRYIAMMTRERVPAFPDVPTLGEQGVPLSIDSPYGVAGPKGMDPALVKTIDAAFKAALETPEVRQTLEQLNQQVNYQPPAEYQQYAEAAYAREKERVAKLRAAGRL